MVEITLDLRASTQHLVHARLRWTPPRLTTGFRLPSWTPGSYLIRDYVCHLEDLQVWQNGCRLKPVRVDPAGWRLALDRLDPLELRSTFLATELTVRTCHLDADHGFLALAAVALQVDGERWSPHRLRLDLPPGWQAFVPLVQEDDGSWSAADFDQLVDTPVEAGPHTAQDFLVAGVPHRWVCWDAAGERAPAQGGLQGRFPALLEDVAAVCEACCRLMGETAPAAPDYLIVLHLLDRGYGGLEHDRSTVLQFGWEDLARPEGYRKLLQLVAHEYLHQWNVRRLRPAELTPIDYDRPTIVPSLWFAEGVTSYLDQFLPLLCGRASEEQLFEDMGADLSRYRLTPGRLQGQSLRQSSQEAWVKLYRRNAYSDDSQISYYLKGAVISLVLDLELRRSGSCLVQVLRDLWQRLGRWGRGYGEADLLAAFSARSPRLGQLLPFWLEGFDDPDLPTYLGDVGLLLVPEPADQPFTGLRCALEAATAGLQITRVERGSPAERAGLVVGDELLALDGWRLRKPEDLASCLRPEREQELTICRRGSLRSLCLTPAPAGVEHWRLRPDPAATQQALERRRQWLALEPC